MDSIDPEVLSRWFTAYAPRLVLYARQWLAPAVAEDVVQEVFIRLMRQDAAPDNVKAWLFRSVRNAAISGLRSHLRRRRRERNRAAARVEWFEPRSDDMIDARAAQEMLEEIDAPLREIIMLRIWGQMSLREIGDVTDLSPATVMRRYRQGLAIVRKRLESSCRTSND